MRRIVVGTDGSQTASRAVDTAAALARRLGAELHLVHGYLAPGGPGGGGDAAAGSVVDQWRGGAEALLAEAAGAPALGGVAVATHVVAGGAADALLTVALAVHADLVVVGNRGVHGSPGELADSVAGAVLRGAPCDVLVARTT